MNINFPMTFKRLVKLAGTINMDSNSYFCWGFAGWNLTSFGVRAVACNGQVINTVGFFTYIAIGF